MNWTSVILEPVRLILDKAALYSMKALGILAILFIGLLIAKFIQNLVTRFLKIAQLDTAADKAGITKILVSGEIKYTLAELIGVFVYWLVMLITIVAAVNALNLTVAAQLLQQMVAYVPNVIAAVFVLAVGIFLAALSSGAVNAVAINAGITQAKLLAKATEVIILVVAVIMALEQLKIATTIINLIIPIVIASVGLALALAFGLGAKDIAGKTIKELLDKIAKSK